MNPWSLDYWKCGEYQVVQERLNDLQQKGVLVNPHSSRRFRALALTPFSDVRVVLLGQDPYPDPKYATGLAFSIPPTEQQYPPTLHNLFKEYQTDLGYPLPIAGDLTPWAVHGVLLWNVIPTCTAYHSLSHDWPEYELLTQEIVSKLSKRAEPPVFIFLGGRARRFTAYVESGCDVIETSHPSPRASRSSKHPFFGSRIFTTANARLSEAGIETIDWRLS